MTTQPRTPKPIVNAARPKRPTDTLDDFPTPPWATRAFIHHMAGALDGALIVEPAANRGLMAEVLREIPGAKIRPSDVHDYGVGYKVGSFVGVGPDVVEMPRRVDWIVTNPPFSLAEPFFARAFDVAEVGVAFLLRTSFLEGAGRSASIFEKTPPSQVIICTERVPMVRGRWDPCVSTAMSYAWFVWRKDRPNGQIEWLARGARKRFSRHDDAIRFGARHEFELVVVDGAPLDPGRLFQSVVAAERSFRAATAWRGSCRCSIGDPVAGDKFRPHVKTVRVAIEASTDGEPIAVAMPLFDEAAA